MECIQKTAENITSASYHKMKVPEQTLRSRKQSLIRGMHLFKNGCVLLYSLQSCDCCLRVRDNEEISIVRAKVCPSYKTVIDYTATIVLSKGEEEDSIMCPPISHCTCPQGINGCSHLSALFIMMQHMQLSKFTKLEEVEEAMPNPPKHYKGMLFSLHLALQLLAVNAKERKEKTTERKRTLTI